MPNVAGTITIGMDPRSPLENDIARIINKKYSLNFTGSQDFTLGKLSKEAGEFSKSLRAAEARVLAFGATVGTVNAVYRGFTNLVTTAVKVEKSLADINSVLGLSSSNLKKFGFELFEVAKKTGQSFYDVAEVAKEFSRQGLGTEQTLKRTRDAMILTRISGLDLQSSLESITASINSFSKSADDSATIINKLAAVDASFAVSSGDLAEAIKRVGSTAEDAGVSMNELLGIVTAVQQTTSRGGAVIGNALKSIFTRVGRNQSLQDLQDLGVQINNTQTGLQKLQAISNAVELNPQIANQVKELAGGVYQINIVSAALKDLAKDYSIVSQATKIANQATDEAIVRNSELNKTIAAISNESLQNITSIASKAGEGLFGPTIKSYLNSFNSLYDNIAENSKNSGVKIGTSIAEGMVNGIGQFLSGPGVFLIAATLGKLAVDFAKFTNRAVASLFNLNSAGREQEAINQEINRLLASQANLIGGMVRNKASIIEIERAVLSALKQQTVELQVQAALRAKLSGAALSPAPSINAAPTGFKFKAGGLIPSKEESYFENLLATKAGYKAGDVKAMQIPGLGRIVYNDNERVLNVGGQPAIVPPKNSKVAEGYRNTFKARFGVDPYEVAAEGYVPNFNSLQKYKFRDLADAGKITRLGQGAFGSVYDLAREFKGIPLGIKAFDASNPTSKGSIAEELYMLKTLRKIQETGGTSPFFNFPRGFGDEIKSAEKGYFLKEIIKGQTARKAGFEGNFLGLLATKLDSDLDKFGIIPSDISLNNVIPNQPLIDFYRRQSPQDLKSLSGAISNPRTRDEIIDSFARFGARLSIIDVGNFMNSRGGGFLKFFNDRQKAQLSSSSSGISNSSGGLSLVDRFLVKKGFTNGLIASGLVPAVSREISSGVNLNTIRIGNNPILSNAQNPLGLGVYNKIDEPFGLQQGINRAISEGKNPKNYGASGSIPNFAINKDDIEFSINSNVSGLEKRDIAKTQIQLEIDNFRKALQASADNQEKIRIFTRELSKKYELSDSYVKKLNSSLYGTSNLLIRRQDAEQKLQTKIQELDKLGFRGSVSYSKTVGESSKPINELQPSLAQGSLLSAAQIAAKGIKFTGPVAAETSYEIAFRRAQEQAKQQKIQEQAKQQASLASIAGMQSVVPTAGSLPSETLIIKQSQEYSKVLAQLQKGQINSNLSPSERESVSNIFGGTVNNTKLTEIQNKAQAAIQSILLKYTDTFKEALAPAYGDLATSSAKIAELTKKGPPIPRSFKFPSSSLGLLPTQSSQFGMIRDDQLIDPNFRGTSGFIAYRGGATTSYNVPSVFAGGGAEAKALKQQIENSRNGGLNPKLQNLNNKLNSSNFAIGSFIVSSMLSGFGENLNTGSLNQRRTGSVLNGLGTAVGSIGTGAVLGSTLPGAGTLAGAGIGAIVGLGAGIYSVYKNWNDILPDLEANLEKIKQSTSETSDALGKYITSLEKLSQIYSGEISASPYQVSQLQQQQNEALLQSNLNENDIQKITRSNGNINEISDIFSQSLLRGKELQKQAEQEVTLARLLKDPSRFSTYSGQELNKQGELAYGGLITSLFSNKSNNKTLSQFIEEEFSKAAKQGTDVFENGSLIGKTLSSVGRGPKLFESLAAFAEAKGFDKQTVGAFKQLGTVGGEFGNFELNKLVTNKIKSIPNLANINEQLSKIQKTKSVENLRFETDFRQKLIALNTSGYNNIGNRANQLNDLSLNNQISQALRQAQLSISDLFNDDTRNNLEKFNNTLIEIGNSAQEAELKLKNDFLDSFTKNSIDATNKITERLAANISSDKGLDSSPGIKASKFNTLSAIVDEFQRNISGVSSLDDIKKVIEQQKTFISSGQDFLLDPNGPKAEQAALINFEIKARQDYIEVLEEAIFNYNLNNEQLAKSTEAKRKIAEIEKNTGKTLIDYQKVFNIGGSLNNFGNKSTGFSIFNLRNESRIAAIAGDSGAQIRALSQIGGLYKEKGLNLSPDIRQELQNALATNIAEQVKNGELKLPAGITPEGAAKTRLDNEFKNNGLNGDIKEISFLLQDNTDEIRSQAELFGNVKEQTALINFLNLKRLTLENDIAKNTKDGLQAQRELTLEMRKQLAIQSETAFKQGRITGDQYRDIQSLKRTAIKDNNGGKLGGGDLRDAFFDQFKYNTRDLYDDLEAGAVEVGQTLKSGFKDAFKEFADGTKSASEALSSFGISILRKLGDRAFDIATNSIFNALGSSIGSTFGYGRKNGGLIRGYSTGGKVLGGSGTKDDVPAMLANGEYVIKKSSTQRYGIDFLDSINAGTALYDGTKSAVRSGPNSVNAVFKNAYFYNDEKQPTAGNLVVDPALSSFALDDENNPQNAIRLSREEELGSFLREKAAYEEEKKAAYQAFRTQRRRAGQAALIQAGISAVGLGISYGTSLRASSSNVRTINGATGNTVTTSPYNARLSYGATGVSGGARVSTPISNYSAPYNYGIGYSYGRSMGGLMRKYASGGMHSRDNIPALLTGGEYVMKKEAVQVYGKQMMDDLNAGRIKKFASGGATSIIPTYGSGGVSLDNSIMKSIDLLKSAIEDFTKKAEKASTQTIDGTTSININVNVDKQGSVSTSSDSSTTKSKDDQRKEIEANRLLAEKIRNVTKQVIIEEQRPNGLLAG